MHKKALLAAISMAVFVPTAHADVDVMGKTLQIYGKLHISADAYDRGVETAAVPNPSDVEITSNSSRLGFKGEMDLENGIAAVWRFESEIDVTGELGSLKARNRYAGLKGGFGTVIAGIHDTPFKDVAGGWDMFGDTVGDRRAIFGQTSAHENQFNQRALNMVQYSLKAGGFEGRLMYAPDFEDAADPDGNYAAGETDQSLASVGLFYKMDGLKLAAAYEQQKGIGAVEGADATGVRVAATFGAGALKVGALYEQLKDDGYGPEIERDAYGANLSYTVGPVTLAGQYMIADNSNAATDDGADAYAAGVFYKLAKTTKVYAMYGALDNDPAAAFRLARSGHGQAYAPTVDGEEVTAASIGLVHSF